MLATISVHSFRDKQLGAATSHFLETFWIVNRLFHIQFVHVTCTSVFTEQQKQFKMSDSNEKLKYTFLHIQFLADATRLSGPGQQLHFKNCNTCPYLSVFSKHLLSCLRIRENIKGYVIILASSTARLVTKLPDSNISRSG